MKALLLMAVSAFALSGPGCTKTGRALVQVTVTLGQGLTAASVDHVTLEARQSGSLLKSATFSWKTGQTTTVVGLYMPEGTTGAVAIGAIGILNNVPNSSGSTTATDIAGNNTVPATVTLTPGAPPPDGGTDGNPDSPLGSGGAGGGGGKSGSGGIAQKWGSPTDIGSDAIAYDNFVDYYSGHAWAAVSVNDSGTAMVAYVNAGKVYAMRRAPHGAWVGPEEIEARANTDASNPQIGVVSDGTAWLTWQQSGSSAEFGRGIYEVQFNGSAWGSKRRILDDSGTTTISYYRMAVNEEDGTAVLVSNWGHTKLHGMFRTGTAWGSDKEFASWDIDSSDAEKMDVAIDNNGHAVAVWYQGTSGSPNSYDLMGCPANAGTNVWCTTPTKLNTGSLNGAPLPSVSLNRSGAGVVAWYPGDETIRARLIDNTGVFASEQKLDGPVARADHPGAVMDSNENATVVWPHRTDSLSPSVWNEAFSRHVSGGSWTGADLETQSRGTETLFGYKPVVAVNEARQVTAVWVEEAEDAAQTVVTRRSLKATRFDGSWATVTRLDDGGASSSAFYPSVASSNVCTVAIWWQGPVSDTPGATLKAIVFE